MENKITEYINYDEIKPENIEGFLFFSDAPNTLDKPFKEISLTPDNSKYDETYNNYKVKIRREFEFIPESNILNYVITVPAKWNTNNTPFLRGLTTQGSINLDLLNSGESELKGWRFFNDVPNRHIRISLFFELYPKLDKNFTNLTLEFYDINGSRVGIYENPGIINNGSTTIELDWNKLKGEENEQKVLNGLELYKVILKYKDCDDKIVTIGDKEEDLLWILTTELFNDCFSSGSANFVSNYCKPLGDEVSIINNKFIIKVGLVDNNNVEKNINIRDLIEYSSEGSLISTDKESIDFTSVLEDIIYIDSSKLSLEIKNPEYYPSQIIENYSSNNNLISAKLNIDNLNELFEEVYNKLGTPFGENPNKYLYIESTLNGATITSKERIKGPGKNANLTNVFVKMSEALPHLLKKTTEYCGVFPDIDYDAEDGFSGVDVLLVFVNKSTNENGGIQYENPIGNDLANRIFGYPITQNNCTGFLVDCYTKGYHFSINTTKEGPGNNGISHIGVDGKMEVDYGNEEKIVPMSDINYGFNELIENDNLSCTWLFSNDEAYKFKTERNSLGYSEGKSTLNNTIIWWRSKDTNGNSFWRASKIIIDKDYFSKSYDLVKILFGLDFYFCFISELSSESSKLFVPDKNLDKILTFKDRITVDLPIKIDLPASNNSYEYFNGKVKFISILDNDNKTDVVKNITITHENNSLTEILIGVENLTLIDNVRGRTLDADGDSLHINRIYVEDNGKLRKVENPFIISDDNSTFSTSDGLVCRYIYCNEDYSKNKSEKISSLSDRNSNTIWSIDFNEGDLKIYFRNVPLIPLIINE